jgi:hypothetical protein
MRRLARAGLIVFQPKPDELAPVVDLAPLRTAVIEYYAKRHGGSAVEPRGATSESGGSTNTPSGCTDTAARGAITEPVVAPSANQSWLDGAATTGGGSGSKTPHRREKSEEAEEGGAALHAPEGLPGDLRRFLEQKGIAVPGRGR